MQFSFKCAITLLLCIFISSCQRHSGTKVGVIVPLEHEAMTEIVNGITAGLKDYPQPIDLKIANAQNDLTIQRAIIQEMQAANYAVVAPIGLSTTKMTMAIMHQRPIVAVAAKITDTERLAAKPCHVSVVQDEIAVDKIIAFYNAAYPQVKQIVLIYSPDEKIYPDVKSAQQVAKNYGITITPKLASSLSDLYAIANNLPATTQGILVLKDNLIVSGIATLVNIAKQQHIPLMTSDEGSVKQGADFALGVPERQIGTYAAQQIIAILEHKSPCSLPIKTMHDFTIFINPQSMKRAGLNIETIQQAAKKYHYPVQDMTLVRHVND